METYGCRLIQALLLAITVSAGYGADNTLGTWKLNSEKSLRSPMKSVTMIREAVGGGIKVTVMGMDSSGAPIDFSYTVRYNGKEYAVTGTGAPYDTISIKQVDANTFIDELRKNGGVFRATVPTVVSDRGKTLTETASGTDANGNLFNEMLVFEKQ